MPQLWHLTFQRSVAFSRKKRVLSLLEMTTIVWTTAWLLTGKNELSRKRRYGCGLPTLNCFKLPGSFSCFYSSLDNFTRVWNRDGCHNHMKTQRDSKRRRQKTKFTHFLGWTNCGCMFLTHWFDLWRRRFLGFLMINFKVFKVPIPLCVFLDFLSVDLSWLSPHPTGVLFLSFHSLFIFVDLIQPLVSYSQVLIEWLLLIDYVDVITCKWINSLTT